MEHCFSGHLQLCFTILTRSCQLLGLLLEELEIDAAALHSYKSQSLRLSALHKFKSGQVPILVATDLASRGLDIPMVDLVINYDIPRCIHSIMFIVLDVLQELDEVDLLSALLLRKGYLLKCQSLMFRTLQ
ncbi:hypothetical protein RND71_015314 [Anisodus tanguticus]|uniref:Helicase C-terminal domain-containing protein n=1 Tax=Anisodus tanguticus TaxID=243964 RepID=A0AAE1VHK3_9SOLA|nr:hypothetical protein RND71_015314 [Anisodus tanguticus]